MTKKKLDATRLIDKIEASLSEALENVDSGTDPETNKPYTITSKTKVWDRVLKLEAIKAKLNEGNWGEGFSDN